MPLDSRCSPSECGWRGRRPAGLAAPLDARSLAPRGRETGGNRAGSTTQRPAGGAGARARRTAGAHGAGGEAASDPRRAGLPGGSSGAPTTGRAGGEERPRGQRQSGADEAGAPAAAAEGSTTAAGRGPKPFGRGENPYKTRENRHKSGLSRGESLRKTTLSRKRFFHGCGLKSLRESAGQVFQRDFPLRLSPCSVASGGGSAGPRSFFDPSPPLASVLLFSALAGLWRRFAPPSMRRACPRLGRPCGPLCGPVGPARSSAPLPGGAFRPLSGRSCLSLRLPPRKGPRGVERLRAGQLAPAKRGRAGSRPGGAATNPRPKAAGGPDKAPPGPPA